MHYLCKIACGTDSLFEDEKPQIGLSIESNDEEGFDKDMVQIQYRTAKESSVYVTYHLDSNGLFGYSGN